MDFASILSHNRGKGRPSSHAVIEPREAFIPPPPNSISRTKSITFTEQPLSPPKIIKGSEGKNEADAAATVSLITPQLSLSSNKSVAVILPSSSTAISNNDGNTTVPNKKQNNNIDTDDEIPDMTEEYTTNIRTNEDKNIREYEGGDENDSSSLSLYKTTNTDPIVLIHPSSVASMVGLMSAEDRYDYALENILSGNRHVNLWQTSERKRMEEEMTQTENENDMVNDRKESISTVTNNRTLITNNTTPVPLQSSSILSSRIQIPPEHSCASNSGIDIKNLENERRNNDKLMTMSTTNALDRLSTEEGRIVKSAARDARREVRGEGRAEELVYRLASLCTSHLRGRENEGNDNDVSKNCVETGSSVARDSEALSKKYRSEQRRLEKLRERTERRLPHAFHQVQLGRWEDEIDWEGSVAIDADADIYEDADEDVDGGGGGNNGGDINNINSGMGNVDDYEEAMSILDKPLNQRLECMDFSRAVRWEGYIGDRQHHSGSRRRRGGSKKSRLKNHRCRTNEDYYDQYHDDDYAESDPSALILEQSVAGRCMLSSSFAIPMHHRPSTFDSSVPFALRVEREMGRLSNAAHGVGGTDADGGGMDSSSLALERLSNNSLRTNTALKEKIIAERQRKREQMAIDKTNRVKMAMGTINMGGGRGRNITSSLMGPGGTERTGRPSRYGGLGSIAHDAQHVPQPEIVYNHVLVKPSLPECELINFRRPKLPRFRGEIKSWQLRVKYTPSQGENEGLGGGSKGGLSRIGRDGRSGSITGSSLTDGATLVSSYKSQGRKGVLPASGVKQIRCEADLSPTEGDLVLLEYCEERPPVQLMKGMAIKIVNYYRGDKTKCPISAGGGDRPARKRRGGDDGDRGGKNAHSKSLKDARGAGSRPPRLALGLTGIGSAELIGNIKGKDKTDQECETINSGDADASSKKEPAISILPEGVTEILYPSAHGPFLGEVEDGEMQTGLFSNLFVAPMFLHKPKSTDFLLILGKRPKFTEGSSKIHVTVRSLPSNIFCVGQTEPRMKVYAPNTSHEQKQFLIPFVTYQIAKQLQRAQKSKYGGLKFDQINDMLFSNTEIQPNALRGRIKQVAQYSKDTLIWTLKDVDYDDFPGVDALAKNVSPEGVAAHEASRAAIKRLNDIGIREHLTTVGSSVANVVQAHAVLVKQSAAAKDRYRQIERRRDNFSSKIGKKKLYEIASKKLEAAYKALKRKVEISKFISEEVQLTPWHLTSEFIDVHKRHEVGTGMMQLTGLGDPSGDNGGFNFLRVADFKQPTVDNIKGIIDAHIKKITGTENDLRKLTMKQMASMLRSYGMDNKFISTLKRWDRVHVIRDYSTKAASDGMGDGMENRYARTEKTKLFEQKQSYKERIQEMCRRQKSYLLSDTGTTDIAKGSANSAIGGSDTAGDEEGGATSKGTEAHNLEDEESFDSDDSDDLEEELIQDFKNQAEGNQIVAQHFNENAGDGSNIRPVTAFHKAGEDEQRDARDLADFQQKLKEEKKVAQLGIADGEAREMGASQPLVKRKVIRRRSVRTLADGTQVTKFKFFVQPLVVDKLTSAKKKKEQKIKDSMVSKKGRRKSQKKGTEKYNLENKIVGHDMFENGNEFVEPGRIKLQLKRPEKNTRKKAKRQVADISKFRKQSKLLDKKKQSAVQDKRMKKRKREAEEKDLYSSNAKRKGTSNRRDRGSARDLKPHVIMADRLEQIRVDVEKRPESVPFHKKVNKRQIPRYYEVISEPIDLQAIRDKNQRYEYRTVDSFMDDFDLMRRNAVKFNGEDSPIAMEANTIFDYVKKTVEVHRSDFDKMEENVNHQMNNGGKKGRSSTQKSDSGSISVNVNTKGSSTGDPIEIGGGSSATVPTNIFSGGNDSGSDESTTVIKFSV